MRRDKNRIHLSQENGPGADVKKKSPDVWNLKGEHRVQDVSLDHDPSAEISHIFATKNRNRAVPG